MHYTNVASYELLASNKSKLSCRQMSNSHEEAKVNCTISTRSMVYSPTHAQLMIKQTGQVKLQDKIRKKLQKKLRPNCSLKKTLCLQLCYYKKISRTWFRVFKTEGMWSWSLRQRPGCVMESIDREWYFWQWLKSV